LASIRRGAEPMRVFIGPRRDIPPAHDADAGP
jgi:hypothetical protein